jgi:hypothetical protein
MRMGFALVSVRGRNASCEDDSGKLLSFSFQDTRHTIFNAYSAAQIHTSTLQALNHVAFVLTNILESTSQPLKMSITVSFTPVVSDITHYLSTLKISSHEPSVVLTERQESILGERFRGISKFLSSCFPQLHDLYTRPRQPLSMEPLPLNWEYALRFNRPLEAANQLRAALGDLPPPLPGPHPARLERVSEYFYEQREFYRENFGPDPFYTPPPVIRPGPLKLFVLAIIYYFKCAATPIVVSYNATVAAFKAAVNFVVFDIFTRFLWAVVSRFRLFPANSVIVLSAAVLIVRNLPGWEGVMGGEGAGEAEANAEPVYEWFRESGMAAMTGTGPVLNL